MGCERGKEKAPRNKSSKNHSSHTHKSRETRKEYVIMRESTKAKGRRILDAMLSGKKITPFEANQIGQTTDGTRFIRFIRQRFPVKHEKVEGELYHRYWIDESYLAELRDIGKQVSEGTFFDNLLAI